MAAFQTGTLQLPNNMVQGLIKKAESTSTIQKLSTAEPSTFLNSEYTLLTDTPEASWVAEGAQKPAQGFGTKPVVSAPHKAVVTVRYDEEVQFADEDAGIGLLNGLTETLGAAVGRALDYGVYHGIDPTLGTVVEGMTHLTQNAATVTASTDLQADVDSLPDKVIEAGYTPNGIALAPSFANNLRKLRNELGTRLYPDISLDLSQLGTLDGLRAAVSDTVNAKKASAATNVLGIEGDFGMIRWGIVRDMGIETIEYGDPDGLGDLKRNNQIAVRAEIVYKWAILDPSAFVVYKATAK